MTLNQNWYRAATMDAGRYAASPWREDANAALADARRNGGELKIEVRTLGLMETMLFSVDADGSGWQGTVAGRVGVEVDAQPPSSLGLHPGPYAVYLVDEFGRRDYICRSSSLRSAIEAACAVNAEAGYDTPEPGGPLADRLETA